MEKMRFSKKQDAVKIYFLENGMDVAVCLNEKEVVAKAENGEETEWEYDGNIFRTYRISPEEIQKSPESYLNYPGDTLPTAEMEKYANEMIDLYTEQLMEEGVIS